jgi:3-deoxy-manno-octulosonate cytidylyltransferase (CMP-KDO synthetase)
MDFRKICFIPARYESTRLPGKPLLKIANKTIIRRVYEQVQQCKLVNHIIVLTDDELIKNEVQSFGGNVYIIKDVCRNGTDRIINFLKSVDIKCDLVVNVQGDEPFINPIDIERCIENFIIKNKQEVNLKCSTMHHISNFKSSDNKSTVKIVLDNKMNIMYGSRSLIPGSKNNNFEMNYNVHIGVFVYDKSYLLNEFDKDDTNYQIIEDIEWLKIVEQGFKINSILVNDCEIGVDTMDDYLYLVNKFDKN